METIQTPGIWDRIAGFLCAKDYKASRKEGLNRGLKRLRYEATQLAILGDCLEDLYNADSLEDLYFVHRRGPLNMNIAPDEYGMFRTSDIRKMTKDEVFLGGTHGLFTRSLSDWERDIHSGRLANEDYRHLFMQYYRLLSSNYQSMQSHPETIL